MSNRTKNKANKSPVKLSELEAMMLSGEQRARSHKISVREHEDWRERYTAIRQALDDHFRRNVTKVVLGMLVGMLLVAIVLPDRYEKVVSLINVLLAATSGFAIGKMNAPKDTPEGVD